MSDTPPTIPGDGNIFGDPPTGGGMTLADLEITEAADSRDIFEGPSPTGVRKYHVWATSSAVFDNELLENYVRSKLEDTAPAVWDSLVPHNATIKALGGGVFDCEVNYGLLDITAEFEFDTTGGQETKRISLGTRKYGTGPTFGGLINCREGRVEGVSVTTPVMTFSETRSFISVSAAYRNWLYRMTGRVNSAAFKGCAAGECLFMGARGRKTGRTNWRVQFNFACSANIVNLAIAGGAIVVARKDGWEYLWIYEEPKEDGNRLIPFPTAAYVEQVYPLGDLASLGIGSV
jgi:hypothetical protein